MSDVSQFAGLRIDDAKTGGGRAWIDSEDAHRDLTPAIDGPYGKAVDTPEDLQEVERLMKGDPLIARYAAR